LAIAFFELISAATKCSTAPTPAASKRYQRHEPETTPLYEIVAEHIEAFLAKARETHERALPHYVERERREYLKCGILAHGFLRAPLVRQGFARCTVVQEAGRVPVLQCPTHVVGPPHI